MERAKYMDAVVATGNIGFGLGLAATQIGLFVGASATNLILDCVIATKDAGRDAIDKGISIEKAIEQRIYNFIGATQEIAKNPSEKLTEHANYLLDIANTIAENILGIPHAQEDPNNGLKERVSFLAGRIAGRNSTQANEFIIDPLHHQINIVLEQLGKCFVLIDYVKQRQEWTYNKVSQLSVSMMELRNKIEVEANRARKSPSEVLLNIIRHYSSKLNEQLNKLRERGSELFSSSMQKQVQSATMYVQQLDDTFVKAQSIDQVKQEVIEEAKHKLNDIAQWSTTLMRPGQPLKGDKGY